MQIEYIKGTNSVTVESSKSCLPLHLRLQWPDNPYKKKKKKTFLKRFTKWKFRSAHRITRIKFQHKKNDYTGHLTQAAYYF